jgi:hypothetical protein
MSASGFSTTHRTKGMKQQGLQAHCHPVSIPKQNQNQKNKKNTLRTKTVKNAQPQTTQNESANRNTKAKQTTIRNAEPTKTARALEPKKHETPSATMHGTTK